MMASKATYLVSLIKDRRSVDILEFTDGSKLAVVGVARLLTASKNLSPNLTKDVLTLLQKDGDAGVRRQVEKILPK